MKSHTAMHEGPQAFENFKNVMKAVVAVPHAVIQARIERGLAAQNPNRRGPKRKPKPTA